jgi:hypothetical protein
MELSYSQAKGFETRRPLSESSATAGLSLEKPKPPCRKNGVGLAQVVVAK